MNWFTGTILYIMIWWLTLFAVLPFGTRPVNRPDGHSGWRGAPEQPRMLRKALITTVVAAIVWAGCYAVIRSDYISFRHGYFAAPEDKD